MIRGLRSFGRAGWLVSSYWLVGAACSREHVLFELGVGGEAGQMPGEGGTKPGGTEQGGTEQGGTEQGGTSNPSTTTAWTEATCVAALSGGKTGDPCVGAFSCTGSVECCRTTANCKGEQLILETTCGLCTTACTSDSDCETGKLCENYQCRACPTEPCPKGWSTIFRNQCAFCVPPNECKDAGNSDCSPGLACLAGLTCLPGCKADPSCCFGNRCSDPQCSSATGEDCLVVGCSAGSFCKMAGAPSVCKCDPSGSGWICEGGSGNVCVPQ